MPTEQRVHGHYITKHTKKYIETNLIFLDTESFQTSEGNATLHTLRCFVAGCVRLSKDGEKLHDPVYFQGETVGEFLSACKVRLTNQKKVTVYAHNLTFDLLNAGIIQSLLDDGWEAKRHFIWLNNPYIRFKKGSKTIEFKDSFSYLPKSIKDIGESMGIGKPDLPDNEDTLEAFYVRCKADVDILMEAVCTCMHWHQVNIGGNWSMSGNACGRDFLFRQYMIEDVCIIHDWDAVMFEREGIFGGIRDVHYQGDLPAGLYREVDFSNCYAQVFLNEMMPYKRRRKFQSMALDDKMIWWDHFGIQAWCKVDAKFNSYPVRTAGGTFYGKGEFWTILCTPEIRQAIEAGELLEIGEGYVHLMGTYNRQFARPLLKWLESESNVPPVAKIMLKNWGRSVPSSFAMRTSELKMELNSPVDMPFRILKGFDEKYNAPSITIEMGKKYYYYIQDQEWDHTYPAVLAFVQSHTRVLMNKLRQFAGDSILRENTDGMTVHVPTFVENTMGYLPMIAETKGEVMALFESVIEELNTEFGAYPIRAKDYFTKGQILSPQHEKRDGMVKYSGVPKKSPEVEKDVFQALLWPKMTTQVNQFDGKGYRTVTKTIDCRHIHLNGWVFTDGTVRPVRFQAPEYKVNVILPPHVDDLYHKELLIPESQHPMLAIKMRELHLVGGDRDYNKLYQGGASYQNRMDEIITNTG